MTRHSAASFLAGAVLAGLVPFLLTPTGAAAQDRSGEELYGSACANCHGDLGTGALRSHVGFPDPLPDFTDCSFASREPDADWAGVALKGGPVRGFAHTMPAFGDALTQEQVLRILKYVRGFCGNDAWPRGELNLPRPLITEKAFPEDEAVITTTVNAEGAGGVMNELLYERRFGARWQIEVALPFGWAEGADPDLPADEWTGGVGDLAVGIKRDVFHTRKSIVSLGSEVKLATGNEDLGLGKGTPVYEPFLAYGQILPGRFFLHLLGAAEFPFDGDRAEDEAIWRGALGRTFTPGGPFARAWSPMVEVLGVKELEDGAEAQWDLLPQLQVTLNTRQHVMANVGFRIPVTDSDVRDSQILVYLLWDWFDGGFTEGW